MPSRENYSKHCDAVKKGRKGTLIYNTGKPQRSKCFFHSYADGLTCETSGVIKFGNERYESLWDYYEQRHGRLPIAPGDPLVYVSFDWGERPVLVNARLLHPFGWLRVRSLVRRSEQLGLRDVAEEADLAWRQTARLMKLSEDYEGTWSDELFEPLQRTLDDMLVETAPRAYEPSELDANGEGGEAGTPVLLSNRAWRGFTSDPDAYRAAEKELIEGFQPGI